MSKPKVRLIVEMHGGTIQNVYVDSDQVEVTDVVFTESTKYLDDEEEFEVKSGPLAGEAIYTHYGPIAMSDKKFKASLFPPVMDAAKARIKAKRLGHP